MFRAGTLLFALTFAASAQTAVEYAVGAGRAAGSAAPMSKVGKSIAGAMSKAAKTLDSAQGGNSSSQTIVLPKAEPPAAPAKKYDDPEGIKTGLATAGLLDKFGEPAFKTTDPDGTAKWVYSNPRSDVTVRLKDGQVAEVSVSRRQTAGVVILQ